MAASQSPRSSPRVLAIGDVGLSLEMDLTPFGFDVVAVATGHEGAKKLRGDTQFAFVVVSVTLPDLGAYDFVASMLQHIPAVRAIVVGAGLNAAEQLELLRTGRVQLASDANAVPALLGVRSSSQPVIPAVQVEAVPSAVFERILRERGDETRVDAVIEPEANTEDGSAVVRGSGPVRLLSTDGSMDSAESLRADRDQMEAERNSWRRNAEQLKQQHESLSSQNAQLQRSRIMLEEEANLLRSTLKRMEQEIEGSEGARHELEGERGRLRATVELMQKELTAARATSAGDAERQGDLVRELERERQRAQKLDGELVKERAQGAQVKTELSALVTRLEDELDEKTKALAQTRADLEAAEQSARALGKDATDRARGADEQRARAALAEKTAGERQKDLTEKTRALEDEKAARARVERALDEKAGQAALAEKKIAEHKAEIAELVRGLDEAKALIRETESALAKKASELQATQKSVHEANRARDDALVKAQDAARALDRETALKATDPTPAALAVAEAALVDERERHKATEGERARVTRAFEDERKGRAAEKRAADEKVRVLEDKLADALRAAAERPKDGEARVDAAAKKSKSELEWRAQAEVAAQRALAAQEEKLALERVVDELRELLRRANEDAEILRKKVRALEERAPRIDLVPRAAPGDPLQAQETRVVVEVPTELLEERRRMRQMSGTRMDKLPSGDATRVVDHGTTQLASAPSFGMPSNEGAFMAVVTNPGERAERSMPDDDEPTRVGAELPAGLRERDALDFSLDVDSSESPKV